MKAMNIRTSVWAVAAALVALGLAALPAQAGLVARYSFDGSNASDLSGNANDGTVGSAVFFTADSPFPGGRAAGTGGGGGGTRVITVPNSLTLAAIDDQLSISFWMKATTTGQPDWVRLFQKGTENNGVDRTWLLCRYGNTTDVNMRVDTVGVGGGGNQNIAYPGIAPLDNTWHHLLYTINNGQYAEYVDGRLSTSGSYLHGDGVQNTRPLYMFGGGGNGQYVGLLDDVAVWDDAKGQSWAATMNGFRSLFGLSLDEPGLPAVASLNVLGSSASAAGYEWTFTNVFPAAADSSPLFGGKAYMGTDLLHHIIFSGTSPANYLGVHDNAPEPGTVALVGLGLLGLARRRARRGAGAR